jgi:hypothetical protein
MRVVEYRSTFICELLNSGSAIEPLEIVDSYSSQASEEGVAISSWLERVVG